MSQLDKWVAFATTDEKDARRRASDLRTRDFASVRIAKRAVRAHGAKTDIFAVVVERWPTHGTPQGAWDHAAGYQD